MRFSSAAEESERIKTHQRSFYAPNLKEHVMQQWGSTDKVRIPKTRPSEQNSWGTYQVCPGTNLSFEPPDSPQGGRTPLRSMIRGPRRLIGPHPPRSTPLFKWIHSLDSETSTPLEEALVRGTSHAQCNPLTLPSTRS
ncbi:hypothetical protein M9H77_09517 [Catharanthus roseus]|uniref:Uncharacterized protein n=1 Tax=Catharanthus roseus TaxID=4058 RepID=A0ACC0C161_CATRO|nr:hypothetical protein M9H77_09517 [Catharanthus roseus]